MKLAVLTAYSPPFRRIAQLCTPSHEALAARLPDAKFFKLPLPHDGNFHWRKMALVSDWLVNWHAVLWLDADCIVPAGWTIPSYLGNWKFMFAPNVIHNDSGRMRRPTHFASLWINSPEAFELLHGSRELRRNAPDIALGTAFNILIQARHSLSICAGWLDLGLVHHAGLDSFQKQERLQLQTVC